MRSRSRKWDHEIRSVGPPTQLIIGILNVAADIEFIPSDFGSCVLVEICAFQSRACDTTANSPPLSLTERNASENENILCRLVRWKTLTSGNAGDVSKNVSQIGLGKTGIQRLTMRE
ncbi:hypothetical protein RB195_001207 [Necator americanus]|uniref:Uncharacterized protein n=1 Tax=Necator americanus TaxID=51031 RepID=A0ABR1DD85_NECAM